MQSIGDWAEAAQALIGGIGFLFLWFQLRAVKQTMESDTHSKLYEHYLQFNKLLIEKPYLYPYFYENKSIDKNDDGNDSLKLRAEVEITCEILAGLLEHAALQRTNICSDAGENCWNNYTKERFRMSQELRNYFLRNRDYYTLRFQNATDAFIQEIACANSGSVHHGVTPLSRSEEARHCGA